MRGAIAGGGPGRLILVIPKSISVIASVTTMEREARRVRRGYDVWPYPAADESALTEAKWRIPSLEWINALWRPDQPDAPPRKILVAGCGTGSEAFVLQRRLPGARIVAVDFSERSIAIADDLARRDPATRDIRFLVADLTSPNFAARAGRGFDFVSCHGVLSYVPEPGRALRNLARCLAPNGALYLGVNGATHPSVGWRTALATYGFDLRQFGDSRRLRETLRVFDCMCSREGPLRVSTKPPAYLASDFFSPCLHNLTLGEWLPLARRAGLNLRGSHSGGASLRRLCHRNLTRVLMPRSRAEVCELEEMMLPATFHRLLFTRQPPPAPPWEHVEALLAWRPVRTHLYEIALPGRARSWHVLRSLRCKSTATNTRIDLRVPAWEVEILRKSEGARTLRDILATISARVPMRLLREQLYLLYLFAVIDLLPPAPRRRQ